MHSTIEPVQAMETIVPKFSLEECLKRYLHDLNVWLQLEEGSDPIPECRERWLADMDRQREDIACVKYWLERIQCGEAMPCTLR